MTSYVLEQGYASGDSDELQEGELLEICQGVSLQALKVKAQQYGVTHDLEGFIEAYETLPTDDLTLREAKPNVIVQLASGGGPDRIAKEAVRRAFAILVLDEAFRRGRSVSLHIT